LPLLGCMAIGFASLGFAADEDRPQQRDPVPPAFWMESPKNWSIALSADNTDKKRPALKVELKNTSDAERWLVVKWALVSYEFIWEGEVPVEIPIVAPKRKIGDPGKAEYLRLRMLDRIPAGSAARDTIDLASYFDLKPGVAYTVRVRRFLDEAGHKKIEERASVISNKVKVQVAR